MEPAKRPEQEPQTWNKRESRCQNRANWKLKLKTEYVKLKTEKQIEKKPRENVGQQKELLCFSGQLLIMKALAEIMKLIFQF